MFEGCRDKPGLHRMRRIPFPEFELLDILHYYVVPAVWAQLPTNRERMPTGTRRPEEGPRSIVGIFRRLEIGQLALCGLRVNGNDVTRPPPPARLTPTRHQHIADLQPNAFRAV
jgi:hypothetical protein